MDGTARGPSRGTRMGSPRDSGFSGAKRRMAGRRGQPESGPEWTGSAEERDRQETERGQRGATPRYRSRQSGTTPRDWVGTQRDRLARSSPRAAGPVEPAPAQQAWFLELLDLAPRRGRFRLDSRSRTGPLRGFPGSGPGSARQQEDAQEAPQAQPASREAAPVIVEVRRGDHGEHVHENHTDASSGWKASFR